MITRKPIQTLARVLGTLLIIAGITAFYFFIFNQANSTTVAMTFLLATLGVATAWGLLEAIIASVAGMLCFNFFFLPPILTFYLADSQNWVALFVFLVTAVVASQLSTSVKQRALEATRRREEMERLYELSRALMLVDKQSSIAGQISQRIAQVFAVAGVAVFDRETDQIYKTGAADLPISDTALHAIGNLTAIAMERARAEETASRMEAARQNEEMKSMLLDALAHEFKTPLTSIKAAASSILDEESPAQKELVTIIDEEVDRLDSLVNETIWMARIEAGDLRLHKLPHAVANWSEQRAWARLRILFHTAHCGEEKGRRIMSAGKILIVDDEPQIRRVLKVILTGERYEIVEARSGEAALLQFREFLPDLVLLDLNMPGMGGLETCRVIRETSDVPVIILTVRPQEDEKVELLDAGADDYVTKPFGKRELLARIRAALRRSPASPATGPHAFTSDDLEIDFEARKIRAGKKNVRLTPKEFDLLRYLVSQTGKPVPHRELLQAVWGPDYGDQTDYLRVFITHLRKKIEPNPSKPQYILTEPWVGYRFAE